MSTDDLTKELRDGDAKTTQPIADLFRIVEKMQQYMETRFDETNARLDATNARLDAIESRFALDLAGVEARLSDRIERLSDITERGFIQVGDKIDALNRNRLQTEADQSNMLRRIRDLESKAS